MQPYHSLVAIESSNQITAPHFIRTLLKYITQLFFILKYILFILTCLLDIKLSDEEIEIIKNNISKYSSIFCNFHKLKTRKSGRIRYIELNLVFPENKSIKNAHDIKKELNYSEIIIHLGSCEKICNCDECKKSL